MATYSIVVTDITDFGDLRCVAGWDVNRGKMIRPEPYREGFWPQTKVNKQEFWRGCVANFTAVEPSPPTNFPHRTEDRVVAGGIVAGEELSQDTLWKFLDQSASGSLEELFNGSLVYTGAKGFVPKDSKCSSLGGIEVDPTSVSIEEYTNASGKLRLRVRFAHSGRLLAPNLTSTASHELSRQKGIEHLNKSVTNMKRIHLRIGLARTFGAQPDRCYLQVNGIYGTFK